MKHKLSYKTIFISLSLSIILASCGSSGDDNETTNDDFSSINQSKPQPQKVFPKTSKGLHINEIMTSNLNTIMDKDFYKFSDWIELYNNSDTQIDISGYYLSDDKDKLTKWQIPDNTIIQANGYLIVWADKKSTKKKELHTNFKLSSKKENIILIDRNKNIIDNITLKDQTSDISASPYNDSVAYMLPTPNSKNKQAYTTNKRSILPTFSKESGFYDSELQIELSAPNNSKIYYTTDGSIPTTQSNLYTKPIKINKTTVLKAISVEDGKFPSLMSVNSYIFDQKDNLGVLSLSIDPKYLYDDEVGIYVDGTNGKPLPNCGHDNNTNHNFAQDWDRPAYIDYFDKDSKRAFSIGLDISISGECSRYYAKKSFSVDLDDKYGADTINYKLYSQKDIDKIKDFKIRAGNLGYEIGDILAAKIVEDGKLNVDYQAFTTTRVYVNGDYWGVYNLREKKNDNFIKANYPDVSKKSLDIIKNASIVKEGSIDEYKKLSAASTYNEIISLIDLDNFIDYIIVMVYSGNEDWSYSNSRAWREKKDGAKWRWMLDDLDEGFNTYNALTADSLNGTYGVRNEHELSHIFNTLMSNPDTKKRFKDRFNYLLDTTLSPNNMNSLIDEILLKRDSYVPSKEPSRWFIGESGYNNLPRDYEVYKKMLHDFANQRRDIVRGQLNNF